MITRIKNLFNKWQQYRRRQAFLHAHLDKLTDPTFLDRATKE